jgi:meso-butanediol dehydrogenase/(S,S)-butanediol dehydrogenase/diacetyl reductase
MPGRLQGKVAMITGGNSGIGEATAHRFAQEGATVVLLARREPEGYAVQQAIRDTGGEACFIPCDVSDRGAVEAAVTTAIDRYDRLHVLFNNAGAGTRTTFPEESDEEWERVLRVNLTGTFLMCRAAWPHLMAAGGGVIINMSSFAAVAGMSEAMREMTQVSPPSASYAAAKAGIEGFTRYLAGLGARHNIRVNCVRPGQILTPRLTTAAGEHRHGRYFEVVQLLKGPGRAADVANTVLFLASEEARFMTAEIINIDGGAAGKL